VSAASQLSVPRSDGPQPDRFSFQQFLRNFDCPVAVKDLGFVGRVIGNISLTYLASIVQKSATQAR
jgi:hypothetical protein